ncbi:MAG: hypothetical protein V4738_14370 [Pseudomonadota bacterium]
MTDLHKVADDLEAVTNTSAAYEALGPNHPLVVANRAAISALREALTPGQPVQAAPKVWAYSTEDGERIVPAKTHEDAMRDGGAMASSLLPYTVPLTTLREALAAPDDSNPNAAWLTEAHALCTDAGIMPGHISDRLVMLRAKYETALAAPVVPQIDYTVIHAFSESQNVSYNETCAMVRNALAAAPKPKEQIA